MTPQTSAPGETTFITWSPDGYALFAGYEKGWAMWSVYGKPGAHSFWSNREISRKFPGEGFLEGVKNGCWVGGGQDLLLIKWKGDDKLWAIEMARSAITGCYNSVGQVKYQICQVQG